MTQFYDEVFDGCDYRWVGGREELIAENLPWLKAALSERGLRVLGKNKRDMIDELLEWEYRRSAQVMLWGNPRYCQIGDRHEPHVHEAARYRDGVAIDATYECDGRPVAELKV